MASESVPIPVKVEEKPTTEKSEKNEEKVEPTKVEEKPIKGEEKSEKQMILVRNGLGLDVTPAFLKANSLYLDSDIYEREGETVRQVNRRQDRFVTERDFSLHTANKEVDVEMLNRYLIRFGKIPSFLRVEKREELCVVATERIAKDQIIGMFQGVFRQEMQTPFSRPLHNVNDKVIGWLDADNLLFGNWSRFLRSRKTSSGVNLKLISYNYTILIFTTAEVHPGDELCELVVS